MKKCIILHGFWFHYEMIPSCLEQFKNYDIDLYISQNTEDFRNWYVIFKRLNISFNVIFSITHKNYDLVILPTDDDKVMYNLYNEKLNGIPCYIINHLATTGNRTLIDDKYKKDIDIHGIHTLRGSNQFHFCGYNYIDVEEKFTKLSNRISIAILGDLVNEEDNFLMDMKNRFINFEDIDFYIINRMTPYWVKEASKYPNIKLFISCNTQIMFKILEKCHYVYFFGVKRGLKSCSACFGCAFTTLCKIVCCERIKSMYEFTTPLYKSMNDRFFIEKITKNDLEKIKNERNFLMIETSKFISKILE